MRHSFDNVPTQNTTWPDTLPIIESRAMVAGDNQTAVASLRDRLGELDAQLRVLARSVEHAHAASEIRRISEVALGESEQPLQSTNLTAREVDVLSFAAISYPNARIAGVFGLTTETVRGYMKDARDIVKTCG